MGSSWDATLKGFQDGEGQFSRGWSRSLLTAGLFAGKVRACLGTPG